MPESHPFGPITVDGSDQLVVMYSSRVGGTIQIHLSFEQTPGVITPNQIAVRLAQTDASSQFVYFRLPKGRIHRISARLLGAGPEDQILLGIGIDKQTQAQGYNANFLIWGLCGNFRALFWPGSPPEHQLQFPGRALILTQANSPLGVNLSIAVPTNVSWKIKSIRFTFTTSAVVATRYMLLRFWDGTNDAFRTAQQTSQFGSTTRIYNFIQGLSLNFSAQEYFSFIPLDFRMRQDWLVDSAVVALDAGDQFTNISYGVEEFYEIN